MLQYMYLKLYLGGSITSHTQVIQGRSYIRNLGEAFHGKYEQSRAMLVDLGNKCTRSLTFITAEDEMVQLLQLETTRKK